MLPYEIFSTLDGSLTVNLSSGECHDAMSLLCSQNVEFGKADPIFNKTPSLSNSYLLRLKCKARNLQLILCPTTTMQKDLYSPIYFMLYRIPQCVGLSERFFRAIVNRSRSGLSSVPNLILTTFCTNAPSAGIKILNESSLYSPNGRSF